VRKLLLILMFLFLVVNPVYANPAVYYYLQNQTDEQIAQSADSADVVTVSNPHTGGGEDLIAKTEQMANDLHRAASRIIVPITLMALILGGLIGIFLPLFRRLAIFAVIGLVLVLWAPMLVNSVVNWVN